VCVCVCVYVMCVWNAFYDKKYYYVFLHVCGCLVDYVDLRTMNTGKEPMSSIEYADYVLKEISTNKWCQSVVLGVLVSLRDIRMHTYIHTYTHTHTHTQTITHICWNDSYCFIVKYFSVKFKKGELFIIIIIIIVIIMFLFVFSLCLCLCLCFVFVCLFLFAFVSL